VPPPGTVRQPPYAANVAWLLRYRGALASNIYAIFWPVYLTRDLHISVPGALGLISLAIMLSLVIEVPTGWLADRIYVVNALQRPIMDTAMMRLANPAERATVSGPRPSWLRSTVPGHQLPDWPGRRGPLV
jgi:hypothetical protein